jgi:hypothetical protein
MEGGSPVWVRVAQLEPCADAHVVMSELVMAQTVRQLLVGLALSTVVADTCELRSHFRFYSSSSLARGLFD